MISALGSSSEIIPLDDCSSIILLLSASNSGSFLRRFKQNSAVRLQLHSCLVTKGNVLSTVKILHNGYHACKSYPRTYHVQMVRLIQR